MYLLKKIALVFILFAGINSYANAELVATPLPGDSRLVEFEYNNDQTYLVLTKPKAVTNLAFNPDEIVLTVGAGDTKNWEISVIGNKKHIFIKPLYENTDTTMTVLTDKRSYQFVLRSTSAGAKWYQRVSWSVPNTLIYDQTKSDVSKADIPAEAMETQQLQKTDSGFFSPENMSFGFEVTGEGEFRPTTIFDDGRFTWFKMPPNLQELPALFSVADGNDIQLVNYIVNDGPKGLYLVAQRILQAGVLKLGKAEVRFIRPRASKRLSLVGN